MVAQTPALKAVIDELEKRVGHIQGMRTPQYIRPIIQGGRRRPELGYSQHSYRNADDLMLKGSAQDPIVSVLKQMKSEGYPVGTILDHNYNSDHWDHIHVEGNPKVRGDPEKPSTWNITPGETVETPVGGGGGTTDTPADTESKNSWWDWLTNPTETAAEELGKLIARIGWAALALTVLVIAVIFMLNEFSKSETGSNLIELAATRGMSAAKAKA